jgi:UPF0755 protein
MIVKVEKNSTVKEVAQMLKNEGVITSPRFFQLFASRSGEDTSFKPGEHEIRRNMAYETLINALTSEPLSDENAVDIVIEEGCTLIEAANKLEMGEVCDGDDFIKTFNSMTNTGLEFEKHLPKFSNNLKFYKMEGYLYPETYTFYKNTSADLVCTEILEEFDENITSDMYERMDEIEMDLDQVITLASIVQNEVSNAGDMEKVASVFENRLADPETYPRLQSDTTYKYIDNVIRPNSKEIDQKVIDAYDTYTCSGLPAGAIGSPGLAAIKAVLYPAKTDYYFFFSDINTGKTYFNKTYEDHEETIKLINEKNGVYEEETMDFSIQDTMYDGEEESESEDYGY